MVTDVLVIGAGAAGLLCAAEAARRGRSVLVVEHQDVPGRKIRISGGGRCNFTNLHTTAGDFLSDNPRFCISALARFTPHDMLALVERHGVEWYEKEAGQLFCTDSAQRIIDLLLAEGRTHGARLHTGIAVGDVDLVEDTGDGGARFHVRTARGDIRCRSLVVASGGLSVPAVGASPFGYRLAERLGHRIVPLRPALVPLTWTPPDRARYGDLAGISFPASVRAGAGPVEHGGFLFTHRGISGPAVLQASLHWHPGAPVDIDLLPASSPAGTIERIRARRGAARDAADLFDGMLPRRLLHAWLPSHTPAQPPSQWSAAHIERLAACLHAWNVHPAGSEGYRTAEVTAGGVDTRELSSQRMESLRVPGLYFIGEVVDVTGRLGGFNFQWAWASAMAAARAL